MQTGCVVRDASDASFGTGFSNAGGGVFATLWDASGISMWFFQRSQVPSGIDTNPNPSSFGTPAAFYPASGCDPATVFGPQIITLYINVCGAFAGNEGVFASTCGSVAPNCSSLVPDPANYNNAYWEINYLKVFTNSSSSTSSSASGSGTATGGAGATTTGAGSNSGVSLTAKGSMVATIVAMTIAFASLL
ncbi:hypothetical protein VNI00_011880 [Paramarasmius palmivorus]|uniref:Uncharacterized protein n=1 Tax=Paramarasmius palmivorus TaxID=297713 RepID=A0AAW0CAC9_9AGAR